VQQDDDRVWAAPGRSVQDAQQRRAVTLDEERHGGGSRLRVAGRVCGHRVDAHLCGSPGCQLGGSGARQAAQLQRRTTYRSATPRTASLTLPRTARSTIASVHVLAALHQVLGDEQGREVLQYGELGGAGDGGDVEVGALGELPRRYRLRDLRCPGQHALGVLGVGDDPGSRPLVGVDDGLHEVGMRLEEGLGDVQEAVGIEGEVAIDQCGAGLDLRLRHVRVQAGPGVHLVPLQGGLAVLMLEIDERDVLDPEPGLLQRLQEEEVRVSVATASVYPIGRNSAHAARAGSGLHGFLPYRCYGTLFTTTRGKSAEQPPATPTDGFSKPHF
jgi:hypothetical protein